MTELVHAAVAGDVREAEEIEEILRSAGIASQLESGEDDSVAVLVPESDLEAAQDAIEAMTEPDDVIAEP
jgi:type III secretory pathway lipoprotein EscJ